MHSCTLRRSLKSFIAFQGGAEASVYQTYKLIHTGRLQALTMSGSDVLYISQLESQLAASKTNRLTLGGLISKLGDDSPVPAKVLYIFFFLFLAPYAASDNIRSL